MRIIVVLDKKGSEIPEFKNFNIEGSSESKVLVINCEEEDIEKISKINGVLAVTRDRIMEFKL